MTRRFVSLTILILFLCGTNAFALQGGISPLSDYQYKRDYAQYEELQKETDAQKRADLLLGFLKEHPINRILFYVVQDYQTAIAAQIEKKDWAKAISMAETMLATLPTDEAVTAAEIPVGVEEFMKQQLQPSRLAMQQIILQAYYSSENWSKAVETQEKLYAAAPSVQGLQLLADIYMRMQNIDKYMEIANKIMAENPIDQPLGFATAYQVVKIHIQKQDMAAATELYTKLMDVYGDKLPPNVTEAQWNPERALAYTLMAQPVYTNKDYPKAIELFEKVLKADPANGDAWYYIGMSKWQTEGQDSALEPFAKSVVLNKSTAARARQYLEQIYKAKNSDSLDGIDDVLAKAKSDLGI